MKNVRMKARTAGGRFVPFHAVLSKALKVLLAVFSACFLVMSSATFAASNVQGSISGQVLDANGNPITGATVAAENNGTGFTRSEVTDADGRYNLTSLPVGEYTVTATASGLPAETRENVTVNVGTDTGVNLFMGEDAAELAAVRVSSTAISPIDIRSTESATILGEQTIDRIPVGRNVTAVALLAPGTTRGDSAFGGASFGGASVAENVCYINGLNVTNFRNGLGCSSVPFEFYQEFQLKTGGYSAEFGRAIGGVINAVTKSGTNEYHYGFNVFYTPWIEGFSTNDPDVYAPTQTPGERTFFIHNSNEERNSWEMNLYASGPILQDKAFFHVLYNPRSVTFEDRDVVSSTAVDQANDNAFWGLKLDWNLTNNHILELTAFSDENETTTEEYVYTPSTDSVGELTGIGYNFRGGDNAILRYTGYLTPDFTLSASYGYNKYQLWDTSTVDETAPYAYDARTGVFIPIGQWVNWSRSANDYDERTAIRVDATWFVGDHKLSFGLDNEENESVADSEYSGGIYYLYQSATPGATLPNGGVVPAGVTQTVRVRYLNNGGSFTTEGSAIYVEDEWQVTDDLMLRLGLRNETFDNKNSLGDSFIKVDNQLAPRLGAAWDVNGDGSLKVFANYGLYYLPVAANTNVRLSGAELDYANYYAFSGTINPDGTPSALGPEIGTRSYNSDGEVPNGIEVSDQDIDPLYQSEFILGFQKELESGWAVGVRSIFRDLASGMDDVTINHAMAARGYPDPGHAVYVLTNPGDDMTVAVDTDGDGDVEMVEFTAEELGYPKVSRKYNAVEVFFERAWDGVWFLQGNYTWSQSYGNTEGLVKSDIGQDDAGITQDFDYPGLMDYAYGPLPNDRRHAFKVFGAYQLADNWRIGANFLAESGRPINAFGVHADPNDPARDYGANSFYWNGVAAPRGSFGYTPFRTSLDLSLDYEVSIGDDNTMNLGIDVFNVFASTVPTEVREAAEADDGTPITTWGLPTAFQPPRQLRLRAQFDF